MKRSLMIKAIAGIFAVSVMMFSFTGCEKNENQSSVKEEGSASESGETAAELTVSPAAVGHEYENLKSIEARGENLYIYEQMNGTAQKEVSVLVSASDRTVNSFSLDAAEYEFVQFTALGNDRLAVIYCDGNNVQKLCTLNTETGEKCAEVEFSFDSSVSTLRYNGSCFTILKNVYTEAGTEFHFEFLDAETLESVRDFNMSEAFDIPEGATVADTMADKEGNIYAYAVEYNMDYTTVPHFYRADSEGNVTYTMGEIENSEGYFTGMYLTDRNTVCLLMTTDYSEFCICDLEAETGETINIHKAAFPKFQNFSGNLSLAGYDFAYISSVGIVGYSFETQKEDVVFSFGEDLDASLKSSYNFSSCGDSIYTYVTVSAESERTFTSADAEGNVKTSAELPSVKGYASAYCADSEGNIYYSETYDPGAAKETLSGFNIAYIFHVLDEKGTQKSSFTIDSVDEYGDAVIQGMGAGKDGNLYMLFQTFTENGVETVVYVTDSKGNVKSVINSAKQGLAVTALQITDKSEQAVCLDSDGNTVIVTFDTEKNRLAEMFSVAIDETATVISGQGKYDLYYLLSDCVYGFRAVDENTVCLADLTGAAENVSGAFVASDDLIYCNTYDSETGAADVLRINLNY